MVTESWFRSLWKSSKKHEHGQEKAVIGVLAFEVASLMSKLVHLWQSLSDKHVSKLREEISNLIGIKKLVSDDEDYIVKLMCMELMQNLSHVARAVARISKKCNDPILKSFEQAFNDMCKNGVYPYGCLFTAKKMDKMMEKMERLIVVTANLYQEMEALGNVEQTLRRMKINDNADSISLVEYEKRAAWTQQDVKRLKKISIWNRTYDYVVHLLASSLFTIFCRIGHVFGSNYLEDMGVSNSRLLESDYIHRSRSLAFTQSSVHPSESSITRFASGPLGGRNNYSRFSSGPLGNSVADSSPMCGRHDIVNFYSGPLVKSSTNSGLLGKGSKSGLRLWPSRNQLYSWQIKNPFSKRSKVKNPGPFNGCISGENGPSTNHHNMNLDLDRNQEQVESHALGKVIHDYQSIFSSKNRLLDAPPNTLGAAALALHYANIIIVIEKLVASAHLIGQDARDDLYDMLTARIRDALRTKLKPFAKSFTSSVYDTVLAAEWNDAMSVILEWLAPLAHNMIRWQSERSYEHQNMESRTDVLLVQTLYFANQEKTETIIAELLVGLNYVWRYGKELNAAAIMECTSRRTFDDFVDT